MGVPSRNVSRPSNQVDSHRIVWCAVRSPVKLRVVKAFVVVLFVCCVGVGGSRSPANLHRRDTRIHVL